MALYWAETLSQQSQDAELRTHFSKVHDELSSNQKLILEELTAAQGNPADVGGYYHPNPDQASKAMRPSSTFNDIVESI